MRFLGLALLLAGCGRPADGPWKAEASLPDVVRRVETLRGLTLNPLPELVVLDRAAWKKRRAPPDELDMDRAGYRWLWEALGIVPNGRLSILGDLAVQRRFRGYYDDATHRLFYITDTRADLRTPQLAHAVVHALQKQHGPLYRLPADESLEGFLDDVSWAWACAREAEAVAIELAWPGGRIDEARKKLPTLAARVNLEGERYALRWNYFPYFAGPRYLFARAKGSLREACAALHAAPPMSTEQVIHPGRAGPPLAVIAPDVSADLGEGWWLDVRTVLGEWTIADWLGTAGDDLGGGLPDSLRWGGDIAHVYTDGERYAAVIWIVWDDEDSARRFSTRVAGAGFLRGRLTGFVTGAGARDGLLRRAIRRVRTAPFRDLADLKRVVRGG